MQRRITSRCTGHSSALSTSLTETTGHMQMGRTVDEMYLAQVKTAAESKAPWYYCKILRMVSGDEAFHPLSEVSARWSPNSFVGGRTIARRKMARRAFRQARRFLFRRCIRKQD